MQLHKHFLERGSFDGRRAGGRQRTTPEQVEDIRESFHRSQRANREIQIPRPTINYVVHKSLKLIGYKLQIVQKRFGMLLRFCHRHSFPDR